LEGRIGAGVELADEAGPVAVRTQQVRQTLHPGVAFLFVRGVLQTVLAILMCEEAGVDAGPARTARRDGGIRFRETDAAFGEAVDVRRLDVGIAVAARLHAEIVGDDEEDVLRLGLRVGGSWNQEQQDKESASHGWIPSDDGRDESVRDCGVDYNQDSIESGEP
jgi:hypothetical protein